MTCHWSIKGDADVDKSRVEEILSADAQQGIREMDKMRAKTRWKLIMQVTVTYRSVHESSL